MKSNKLNCPNCEMRINDINIKFCPKCSQNIYDSSKNELFIIDVAHNGEDWFEAKEKILDGVNNAIRGNYKGLKVIHGQGIEKGHTNIIKQKAIPFLRSLALKYNSKCVIDKQTSGAHILYFN